MVRVPTLFSILLLSAGSAEAGEYIGKFKAEFLDDGRRVKLIEDFSYKDDRGKIWLAPAGTTVDGASIPQSLWSLIGGPFEGKYRNASVIHDYYCDRKTEAWYGVHQVFYEAMLASGVSESRAKVMYLAVFHFGPRWPITWTDGGFFQYDCNGSTCYWDYLPPVTRSFSAQENPFTATDLEAIERHVAEHPDETLDNPETLLDRIMGRKTVVPEAAEPPR